MFSSRTPSDLSPNPLAAALDLAKREGQAFIDLTESNPTTVGFDYAEDLLAPLADPRGRVYVPRPFGLDEAREAVSRDYARQGLEVTPDRIVLTASTSEAYAVLFKLLADEGDEILVPRPSYPLFEHLARLEAVTPSSYDLEYHGVWSVDFDSLERAMSERTRAVIAVSPNNPTGSYLKRDELTVLARLCADRGVAVIADEVFADYELAAGAAAAAGRPASQHECLSFSLGGLSKAAGLPQLKLAWIAVAGPSGLVDAALERLEVICDTYLSVSTPIQLAAPALLERSAVIRRQISERVVANYRQLERRIVRTPSCQLLPSEGGWYAALRLPSTESEDALVVRLLRHSSVLAHPGYFFDFPGGTHVIVSLLPPEERFAAGIDRILRYFDCTPGTS